MLDREVRSDRDETSTRTKKPGQALLRAAMSGLLGVSGAACADEKAEEADPEITDKSPSTVEDLEQDTCKAEPAPTAGKPAEEADKEVSVEDKQYTFAQLSALCDDRGGYIQTHASCSGVNSCRGFTYGDWDEDAQLVEHTCSFANGCAGLSCVEMKKEPEKGGLTGEEIMKLDDDWYTERAGNYGPKACKTCHVPSEKHATTGDYVYDFSKLRMLFWPGDGRDASNWTKRPVKYQEAVVAFGVHGIREDGTAYFNMAAYKELFSKTEIERVVKYMRDFKPEDIVVKEINEKPGMVE